MPVRSAVAVRPAPKASILNARVTKETRLALEAEATRSGRSLSGTVELWLELSRRLEAGPLTDTIAAMLRYAAVVERLEGPADQSLVAQALLREGLAMIARNAVPFVSDATPVGKAALDAISALRTQAIRALGLIPSEGEAALQAVSALLARLANARLHPLSVDWAPSAGHYRGGGRAVWERPGCGGAGR